MIRGFTFERALSWPFTAPHAAAFPWIFGLAYALVFMAVFGALALLGADDVTGWIAALDTAQGSIDPEAGFTALFASLSGLIPWLALGVLASWMLWAMFETASQRRYIRGEAFSLGFGADEARIMVIGLLWGLIGFALIAVPILLIMWSALAAVFAGAEGMTDAEVGERILAPMFGGMGLLVLILPLYVFLATRLAPCFGLTVRERKIRFFDAWNVSRTRAWPILGAYVILAFAGGIAGQVITGVAQVLITPASMDLVNAAEQGADVRALLLSPQFLAPISVYLFIVLFVQGVLQHVVAGPAAFAVRHDPRGGIKEDNQIEVFD